MRKVLPVALLFVSGCISIATHEQQMKDCREKNNQLTKANAELAQVKSRNTDLEKKLEEQSEEHEALKGEMSNVRNTYDELVQELKDSIASGEVGVRQTKEGLTITMGNQILFASGSAELQPRGQKVLSRVSGVIRKSQDKLIEVEGHTDNVRIAGALKQRFASNWDLSAARAASVVRYLQEKGRIDASLLMLTAFAETRPIADNNTPRGRQQNRRVEISLVPKPKQTTP